MVSLSMFHAHHHKSLFPYILVTLTLILAITVLFLYGPQIRQQIRITIRGESFVRAVTNDDYERNAGEVFSRLDERLAMSESSSAKEEVVQQATNELLDLIVTEDYTSTHLQLVITLNLLKSGHRDADQGLIDEGTRRLKTIRDQFSWL